ncbi:acyl carrier protein [Streptomyces monashensis]|uniref:acyl carrier protein n=1 Tax=Streptomyces monashensis TaxID=1678012 RepID=UPI0033DE1B70
MAPAAPVPVLDDLLVRQLGREPDGTDDSRTLVDLGIESRQVVHIVAALPLDPDVEVDFARISRHSTLGDLRRWIAELRDSRGVPGGTA